MLSKMFSFHSHIKSASLVAFFKIKLFWGKLKPNFLKIYKMTIICLLFRTSKVGVEATNTPEVATPSR